MAEEYKIELGIQLKDEDIRSQISDAQKKVEPIKIDIDLKHTQQQIDTIKSQINSLDGIKIQVDLGTGSSGSNNGIKQATNEIKRIQSLAKKIGNLDVKIGKLDTKSNVNQIKELERQLQILKVQYDQTVKTLNAQGIKGFGGAVAKEFVDARNKLAEFEAKLADTKAKLAKDIEVRLNAKEFSTQVLKVDGDVKKLSNASTELQEKLNALKTAELTMNSAFKDNTLNVDEKIQAYNKYKAALELVENQLKQNKIAEQSDATSQKLKDDIGLFQSKIDAWLTKNSAAVKKFGSDMQDLKAKAQNCDRTTLNHLEAEFKQVDRAAEAAGVKAKTFGDSLKSQFAKYSSYFSVASIFMYAQQGLRSMFEQVKLIDAAMTELKKVTNETDAAYSEFLTNAADRAKAIGTTIDGLVSSTADFARLGYGFKDAQGLAEVANIYAVVGDEIEGVEGATESLISTMSAFKDEMNDMSNSDFAMSIVDKFNEIGNNFAISSGGIGEALERSASSLMAANNTLDESIALITAANTVVQDPAQVGTAFKTISMRIRGAKTEMSELGLDTEGMVDSTAKLREEIMALSGVDIMISPTEFKSTYQIMDELAQKWEDLTDIQQAKCLPDNVEIH